MYKMTDEEFYEVYGRMPRRTDPKKRKKKVKVYWHRIIIALIILALVIIGIVKLISFIAGKVKGDKEEESSSSKVSAAESGEDYYAAPENKEKDAQFHNVELTVCIDPAHGGFDNGTSDDSGRLEKTDTLNIALALKQHLEGLGVKVIMTRTDDTFLSVEERAAAANNGSADLFVSIHRSSTDIEGSDIHGFEAWINNAEPEKDRAFAQYIMAKLEEIGISENKGVRAGYDNDKSVNYPITEITKMPCVLLDMGYVTSSIDNQLLDANIEAYARAIGNGIIESAAEQGIIDKNGKRLVSGQLTSEKAVAGKKPDVSAENDSESRPDESSVPDDESQAEINEWGNYDDPSQNENAADGFEYTDDGVGYYTDPMMTE